MVVFFLACNQRNDLGMELLPSGDIISVYSTVIRDDISSYAFREDSIQTDEASKSLLGSINDPIFGTTTIDFATQFRLQFFPDYGDNPTPDSIKLYLYYRLIYGDTTTVQKFRVYELESPLDIDEDYYHEVDLKSYASDNLLAEIEYQPRVTQDSATADTFYQLLIIPLNISLAEKLVFADSTEMANNDVFLNIFKGLYIETEKVNSNGGTILSLEAASNSSFQGSALLVYYNNDENRAAETPDTLSMPFVITQYSARVNKIEHDYTKAAFYNKLGKEDSQDSLLYVQATGGVESKIYIDNLTNWQDSANTAINKAELVFQIDTVLSELDKFAAPNQLLLTVINDEGKEYLPIDYLFSPTFYGGVIGNDNTYRFNITQHVQRIIDGEEQNYGFFLTTALKNSEANRVVLKGATSKTGIKLVLSYSKYLQ